MNRQLLWRGVRALPVGHFRRTDDPAGAIVTPDTILRPINKALDPAAFRAENDFTGFFEVVDDLVLSGTASTNANDLCVNLVELE